MKDKKFLFFIIFLSLPLIITGEFELIELRDHEIYKYMKVAGYLLQSLFWILFLVKQSAVVDKKR